MSCLIPRERVDKLTEMHASAKANRKVYREVSSGEYDQVVVNRMGAVADLRDEVEAKVGAHHSDYR